MSLPKVTITHPEPRDRFFLTRPTNDFSGPRLLLCGRCGKSAEIGTDRSAVELRTSHVCAALGTWSETVDDWLKRQERERPS